MQPEQAAPPPADAPRETEVVVTWLEMSTPEALLPARAIPEQELAIVERPMSPERSATLYRRIGGPWFWTDRLDWDTRAWEAWLRERRVRTWVARHEGRTVGYYEIAFDERGAEIAYLGLGADGLGRGWGGWLLTCAARSAWAALEDADAPARRVWLYTCTLDHPSALANYLARGFTPFRSEREQRTLHP